MATESNALPTLKLTTIMPFLLVSFIWIALALVFCFGIVSPGGTGPWLSAKWLLAIWALCLVDLFALARAVFSGIQLISTPAEARTYPAQVMNTIFWGVTKLACLGIIIAVLFAGGHTIPQISVFAGFATLVIVPVMGGLWWSQKELRHA